MKHPDVSGAITVIGEAVEYDVPLDEVRAPPACEVAEPSELR